MIQSTDLQNELRRVVQGIQNVFLVDGDLAEEDVETLHRQLDECTEAINDRLLRCDALLRKGLRNEAIQECETPPHLLDLVTELDFPEADAWAHYVRQFGIPAQPPVLLDVAAALNEAYNEAQPLENLLQLHRLHALARSPLETRIQILRVIASKDPANDIWKKDIRSYEKVRLGELEKEYHTLHKQGDDLNGMGRLVEELKNPSWMLKPAQAFVERVDGTYRRMEAASARQQLSVLRDKILAAFSEFDIQEAKACREQWDLWSAVADLSDTDPLAVEVAPAFDWLNEETRAESQRKLGDRTLAKLEQGLDKDDIKKPELLRLYSTVEKVGVVVPERLERRYGERLISMESQEKRRGRLVLLTSLATVLLIGAVTGFGIFWHIRGGEIETACNTIEELIQQGEYDEAEQFYSHLESEQSVALAAPRMQELQARLKSEIAAESARMKRLDGLVASARRLLLENPTWGSVARAKIELDSASSIAKHDHETVEIKRAEKELARERRRLQLETDDKFQQDIATLLNRKAELRTGDQAELDRLIQVAHELKARPRVSDEVKRGSQIDALVVALRARENEFSQADRRRHLLAQVKESSGHVKDYADALKAYTKAFKKGARARDFKDIVSQELAIESTIAQWNSLAAKWNRLDFRTPEKHVGTALEILSKFEKGFSEFPGVASIVATKSYLACVKKRAGLDPGETPLVDNLANWLENHKIRELQYLETLDGTRFYFVGKPTVKNSQTPRFVRTRITVNALTDQGDWDVNFKKEFRHAEKELRRFTLPPKTSGIPSEPKTSWTRPVPYKTFVDRATTILSKNAVSYEKRVCGVLHKVFSDTEMEPILKVELLGVILDFAKPGSIVLEAELKKFEKSLLDVTPTDAVNWFSQDDPNVALATARAKRGIEDIKKRGEYPSRRFYEARIKPRVDRLLFNRRLPQLTWVGFLLRNESGEWNLMISKNHSELPLSGSLTVREFLGVSDFFFG